MNKTITVTYTLPSVDNLPGQYTLGALNDFTSTISAELLAQNLDTQNTLVVVDSQNELKVTVTTAVAP